MFHIYADGKNLNIANMNDNQKLSSAVLNEEINKSGTLTFAMPPQHYRYSEIKNLKSLITVYDDNEQIFKGRVLNSDYDIFNQKKVIAEGEMAYFNDSVFQPSVKKVFNTQNLLPELISQHNSQVEESKHFYVGNIDSAEIEISNLAFIGCMKFIQNELIKVTNGYVSIRYQNDKRYLDFRLSPGSIDTSNKIVFGKNIFDLNRFVDTNELYTVIIPYGDIVEGTDKPLDISSVNDGKIYIENKKGIENFGRIVKEVEFKGIKNPNELFVAASKFTDESISQAMTVNLTAAEIIETGPTQVYSFGIYKIGLLYKVISHQHGIDDYFLCSKKKTDLFNIEKNIVTLGHTKKLLTDYIGRYNNVI